MHDYWQKKHKSTVLFYLMFCFIETFVLFLSYADITCYAQSFYWLPIHPVSKVFSTYSGIIVAYNKRLLLFIL
jgi:hypothetical protein